MGKYRQVAVMVQKQMELYRPFRLTKLGPIKKAGAKLDHRGIQTEELVPESKLPLAEIQLPALAQELVKYLLVQLPRPMFIGIGQRRSLRSRMEPQMLRFTKTTGQAAADLSQRMGLSQLAKKHGHKLVPATESLGASFGLGCMNRFKELTFRKKV